MGGLVRILCVEVVPCPAAQGGVTITTADVAHFGEIERAYDMVVLGDAALLRVRPEPPIPSRWVGCITGAALDVMNDWREAGLRRIVDVPSLDLLLTGHAAPRIDRSAVHAALGRTPPSCAIAALLGRAVEPHLTRDVEVWSRRAGICRRSLERELQRSGLPPPRRILAALLVAEARRMRARGDRWGDIASALDYSDASSLIRFLRNQREKEPLGPEA